MTGTQRSRIAMFTGAVAALLGGLAPVAAQENVDIELILAVDVSLSMSPSELEIQRAGYAAALCDKTVTDAIASGARGRIAIAYFEWAGATTHHVIVPWTIVATPEDAERVAQQLTLVPPNNARRTSISAALEFADDLFAESPYASPKRVIDVSGDGPNNQGAPVADVRDSLAQKGIVINGLPLMTNGGFTTDFDMSDLDVYYRNCVVGGPGAFTIPVNEWTQFPEAVRRKLVLEIAGAQPMVMKAQFTQRRGQEQDQTYDCQIGEKIWRNRQQYWDAN